MMDRRGRTVVRRFALAAAAVLIGSAGLTPVEAEEIEVTLREGTNFAVALSPAGALFLDLQGTLWRASPDAPDGEAVALTDGLGDDRQPDVAADGSRIVFQSYRRGTWDIWSIAPDGSGLEPLTEGPFDDREPALTPDGAAVIFSSDRSGNYDLWRLAIASGELTQLTRSDAHDYMPDVLPSGDAVVFVSERGRGEGEELGQGPGLYRLELEANEEGVFAVTPVATFGEGVGVASPSVSPDGSRVAVRLLEPSGVRADAAGDAPKAAVLEVVTLADGSRRRLAAPEDVFPFRPQWDGPGALVYTARGAIWRHSLDEEAGPETIPFEAKVTLDRPPYGRRRVPFPESRERRRVKGIVRPVVSSDGSRIAFTSLGDLWMAPAEGGDPVPLTRDEYLDSDPHWSPDGRFLVFSSDRDGTMDLWLKEVDAPPGAGERRLTTSPGAEIAPAWSPDGRTIAYVDEESRLHVIPSAVGGEDRVLTAPRRGVSQPSWSSDSRHVAMAVHDAISSRFREGRNRIAIVDTTTGEERLLEEPSRSFGVRDSDGPVWSPDGRHLAFAMDAGLWLLPVSPDGRPRGRPRPLVGEPGDFPSFWGDSGSLLYVTARGLRRADVETGRARDVELRHTFAVKGPGGRLVIQNVRIVDATGSPPRDGMDVVVENGRIASIEPTGADVGEEIRVVDGSGKTLIPGLIEMHAHSSLPAWGSRHGKVWLAYGVTSMRTPADAPLRMLEERESIQAGRRVGPRVFFTGGVMDGDRIYYTGAIAVEEEEELEREMERAVALGYDLIKTYVRLPDALQKLVVEKAHARGLFVTSHEIYPAVRFGIDGVEHVRGTSRRGYSPKITDLGRSYDDVVELAARSRVFVTPTLLIYGGFSLALAREPDLLEEERFRLLFPPWVRERAAVSEPPDDASRQRAVMEPVFETVEAVAARGGRIVAGTDSPIVPYGLALILEIEQLAEAGLGPMGALRAATAVAAEALGASDDLGTIEPGKIADLVLLGGDPTEDIRNLRKTEMVVVDGRLVRVDQLLGRR